MELNNLFRNGFTDMFVSDENIVFVYSNRKALSIPGEFVEQLFHKIGYTWVINGKEESYEDTFLHFIDSNLIERRVSFLTIMILDRLEDLS